MSSKYRYGETNPVNIAFKSGVAVNIGDLCYIDEGDSYTVKPAGSYTWGSAQSTPSAPTVADSGVSVGSNLTNGATHVKMSANYPWGEGVLSAAGVATPTTHAALLVSAVALPLYATSWNYYVETSAGSATYKLAAVGQGEDKLIFAYGNGRVPPASPATITALLATQYPFIERFIGVAGQRYDGTNAAAYGIQDLKLRIDTSGVYTFDCAASSSFNSGDWVGPDKASGNALLPQQVVAVSSPALAIGRVTRAFTSVSAVDVMIEATRAFLNNVPTL